MRSLLRAAVLALCPVGAAAQGSPLSGNGLGASGLDFQSAGPLHDLAMKTIGVAQGFLFLALVVALIIEAFGTAPDVPRNYGAVVWRFLLVFFLLIPINGSNAYLFVFNGMITSVFDPLAVAVAPQSGFGDFLAQAVAAAQVATNQTVPGSSPLSSSFSWSSMVHALAEAGGWKGLLYDGLMVFLLILAEGLLIAVNRMGRVLAALMFCLGPIALVASVPRPSHVGAKWFHEFVTFLSWPIVSGLLLQLMVALAVTGANGISPSGSGGVMTIVVTALMLGALALSTPRLSSQLVGGSLENLVGTAGLKATQAISPDMHRPREARRDGEGASGGHRTYRTPDAGRGERSDDVGAGARSTRDRGTEAKGSRDAGSVASNPPGPTRSAQQS